MNVLDYCPTCGDALSTKHKCPKCEKLASDPSTQKTLYFLTAGAVSLLVIGLIGGIVTAIINWL